MLLLNLALTLFANWHLLKVFTKKRAKCFFIVLHLARRVVEVDSSTILPRTAIQMNASNYGLETLKEFKVQFPR